MCYDVRVTLYEEAVRSFGSDAWKADGGTSVTGVLVENRDEILRAGVYRSAESI